MTTAAPRALAHPERPARRCEHVCPNAEKPPKPGENCPFFPVANSFSSHVIGPVASLHPESNALFTHRAPPLIAQRGFVQPAV